MSSTTYLHVYPWINLASVIIYIALGMVATATSR